MSLTIRPVRTSSDEMLFIKTQWNFYKGDPNFVPPLIMDRQKLLSRKKNPFFQHAQMEMFLAEENGVVVGRIAAIVNDNHNIVHEDKIGFWGFFECANRQDVANELFETAAAWLRERGMTDMRGPVNPSMNDESGLLIDGFDKPAVILMTYNPAYYQELVEQYGFHKEMDLFAYHLNYHSYRSEKMIRLVDALRERSKVSIRQIDFKNKANFRRDIDAVKVVFNKAWEKNWGAVQFTDAEFDFLAADLKQIAEPSLTLLAELNGEVIGFALALPDINQCLIHNKRGGIIGGIWHLLTKKKKIDLARVIVLGVLPEYRNSGIDTIMYYDIGYNAHLKGMDNGESSWILENNVKMNRALTQTMKANIYKTYRVYQKPL